jgi:hypothetical protein
VSRKTAGTFTYRPKGIEACRVALCSSNLLLANELSSRDGLIFLNPFAAGNSLSGEAGVSFAFAKYRPVLPRCTPQAGDQTGIKRDERRVAARRAGRDQLDCRKRQ